MIDFLLQGPLYQFLFNVLIVFYRLLGDNLLFAIVGTAIISRILIWPLTSQQQKLASSSKEFQEKTKEVQKKYKKNKEKQQEELLKLQQQYLPSQLGGCLSLPVQLLLFINIYNVIREIIENGVSSFNAIAYSFIEQFPADTVVDFNILGGIINLHSTPNEFGIFTLEAIPYLLLIVALAATQFYSFKIMTSLREKNEKEEDKKKKKKKKKPKSDDTPESFEEIFRRSTRQTAMIMPFIIAVIFYNLPSGLAIYLITSNLFVIIQQYFFAWYRDRSKSKDIDIQPN